MNLKNRTFYIQDNLPVLRGVDSGCVDLIATDPPFNSGRVFKGRKQTLNDSWKWQPDYTEWLDTYPNRKVVDVIESALHAHTRGLAAYLCFMAMRLAEMKRVLKADGTLYVHCDDAASHYLKATLDAIFGAHKFAAEIVWERTKGGKVGNNWGRVNDRILVYGRKGINRDAIRVPLKETNIEQNYRHEDQHGRYRIGDLTGPATTGLKEWRGCKAYGNRVYSVPQLLPAWFRKPTGYDNWEAAARLDELDRQGLIHWGKGGTPSFKRYLSTNRGEVPTNVWTDIAPLGASAKARELAEHWTTQKPVALYERIILASSDPGDMVLDPFCGCATTCIAAERNGRHWVGIEQSEAVAEAVISYLHEETRTNDMFVEPDFTNQVPTRTDGGDSKPGRRPAAVKRKVDLPKAEWQAHRDALAQRHDDVCQGCFKKFPGKETLELDHIVPRAELLAWNPDISAKVVNDPSNLTILCSYCNRVKGSTRTLRDLRELRKAEVEKKKR